MSRLKTNARAIITGLADPSHSENIGKNLEESTWDSDIIDLTCRFGVASDSFQCRVVGFWNTEEKKYHFYLTNLDCAKEVIWPLYRARWQIELAFKAMKQSIMPSQITSYNPMIIRNLLLHFLVRFACFLNLSAIFRNERTQCQENDKETETSIQKLSKVVIHISREIYNFITKPAKKHLAQLRAKIRLFANEVSHKRQESKPTSRENLQNALNAF